MTKPHTYESIELGDFALEDGRTLEAAHVGCACWGAPAEAAERVVVLPSYYSGIALSYRPWVGNAGLFNPETCCVIAFDQFGSGKSSKPSDGCGLAAWPAPTLSDNIRAQKRALATLGIDRVDLVAGWSMGGMQAFVWHALFPDAIGAALAICATPAPSAVNRVFLEGIRAVLVGKPGTADLAAFDALPADELAHRLSAFGAVYAGWAYSDEFFLSGAYRQFGYESPETVLDGWARDHVAMNAADLAAQLDAWLHANVPERATADAGANADNPPLVAMPSRTDRYFLTETLEDARDDFPGMEIVEIDSDLGHIAGRPGIREAETEHIKAQVDKLFSRIAPRHPEGIP